MIKMTPSLFWSVLRQMVAMVSVFLCFSLPQLPVHAAELPPIRIAAAANLNGILIELTNLFSEQAKQSVDIVYGSSGNFYQQIVQGAQFDVFLSANEEFADRLVKQGLTQGQGVVYARGRLVLWVSPKSKVTLDQDVLDVRRAFQDGRIDKFAIANPALAPYGLAASESLKRYGLMDLVQSHLVMGSDVGQTILFLKTQSAQAGMLPLSMVLPPHQLVSGPYILIPENFHTPIFQKMVLMKNAAQSAQNFYRFLQTNEARKIWRKYGYE
jgi:molybdate transport system substrate-binding protein